MATGSEILSYGGNAAAGGGYAGDLSQLTGGFDEFNKTMAAIAQDSMNRQVRNYEQTIKDRDTVNQMIASNQIDFEVDPAYRPELEKMIEEIKNIRTSTPFIMRDPQKFAELQDKIGKFKDATTAAKGNTIELKKLDQMYANNPDPEDRKEILAHKQKEISKGLKGIVTPFQKLQGWDMEIGGFAPAAISKTTQINDKGEVTTQITEKEGAPLGAVTETPTTGGAGGAKTTATSSQYAFVPDRVLSEVSVEQGGIPYKQKVIGTRIQDIKDYYYNNPKMIEGPGNNLPNKIKQFYDDFVKNPSFNNPDYLARLNARIDAINKDNNLQPGDLNYTKPIAEVGADGRLALNATPIQVAEAMTALPQYQFKKTSLVVDEDLSKARLTKGQTAAQYANAAQSYASANKSNEDAKAVRAKLGPEIDLLKAQAEKARSEGNPDAASSYEAAVAVGNLVNGVYGQRGARLNPTTSQGKAAAIGGPGGNAIPVNEFMKAAGVTEKGVAVEVDRANKTIQKGMAIPYKDPGTNVDQIRVPQKAWVVVDGSDIKIIGAYKPLDAKQHPEGYELISYTPAQVSSNYVSESKGFKDSDKTGVTREGAFQLTNQLIQSGINAVIQQRPAAVKQTTVATPAATVQQTTATERPIGTRQTLDGVEYEWKSVGGADPTWYKVKK